MTPTRNRAVVLVLAVLTVLGALAVLPALEVDLHPDPPVEVRVHAAMAHQPPRTVEDQVAVPLAAALRSLPGVTGVRSEARLGEAEISVRFRADPDDARARVLAALATVRLPDGVRTRLVPVGVPVATYVLTDLPEAADGVGLGELRALQDWTLAPAVSGLAGVAGVRTRGGQPAGVRVEVLPERLRALDVPLEEVRAALAAVGPGVATGPVRVAAEHDLERLPVRPGLLLGQLADIAPAGQASRQPSQDTLAPVGRASRLPSGVDLDGRGQVVATTVLARPEAGGFGVARRVEELLATLELPPGVQAEVVWSAADPIRRRAVEAGAALWVLGLALALAVAVFLRRPLAAIVAVAPLPIALGLVVLGTWATGLALDLPALLVLPLLLAPLVAATVASLEDRDARIGGAVAVTALFLPIGGVPLLAAAATALLAATLLPGLLAELPAAGGTPAPPERHGTAGGTPAPRGRDGTAGGTPAPQGAAGGSVGQASRLPATLLLIAAAALSVFSLTRIHPGETDLDPHALHLRTEAPLQDTDRALAALPGVAHALGTPGGVAVLLDPDARPRRVRAAFPGDWSALLADHERPPALVRTLHLEVRVPEAAAYGLAPADLEQAVRVAVGGERVTELYDGPARIPVTLAFPERDLATLPVPTPIGATVPLGHLVELHTRHEPAARRSGGWPSPGLPWRRALLGIAAMMLVLAVLRPAGVLALTATALVAPSGALWLLWATGRPLTPAVLVVLLVLVALTVVGGRHPRPTVVTALVLALAAALLDLEVALPFLGGLATWAPLSLLARSRPPGPRSSVSARSDRTAPAGSP